MNKSNWALVAGFGNPLMGDDGLGPRAVEVLRGLELPTGVDLVDAGSSALDLVPLLEGKRLAVLIDAIDGHGPAGTIYHLDPAKLGPAAPGLSLHSLGLAQALKLWELQLDPLPELIVLGVQPQSCELRLELSPDVTAALPSLCRAVIEELRQFKR